MEQRGGERGRFGQGLALRQLEIQPAILWTRAELPATKALSPASSAVAEDDTEAQIRRFMTICQASARQKAIQFGGMVVDEAGRHAASACAASQPAFRACLSLKPRDADGCTAEVNPSAE